jgi:hypothetical protein
MNILDQLLANLAILPVHYERDQRWQLKTPYTEAANRYTIQSPNRLSVNVNNSGYALSAQVEIDLSVAANWDTTDPTDYTVAANRAGKDFYIYACQPTSGVTPLLILSANSTVPAGYTTSNSRKVAGFHCLCADVGVIASHDLTDFATGDVLPLSIWDLKHKPREATPEGMVYSPAINKWVDIYLTSGTGTSTASVYGGTISDNRTWLDFVDDGMAVKKRLLRDAEYQAIAAGSNEQTNIKGGADPVTTGGHVNTASRRMISNIGCEDCCGAMWQWLDEQSYQLNADGSISSASKTATITHDAAPGGNPVYLKYGPGRPYLCSNMADSADKIITFGTAYTLYIRHDADAATGSYQVYFDEDASQPNRLLCALPGGNDDYLDTSNPAYLLPVVYNATPATPGVAISYDTADSRLEFTSPTSANGTLDIAINSIANLSYKTIGGSKGQLYSQGTYGDVKLLAGGTWYYASACGSRARFANRYRWDASLNVGSRFAAEPL